MSHDASPGLHISPIVADDLSRDAVEDAYPERVAVVYEHREATPSMPNGFRAVISIDRAALRRYERENGFPAFLGQGSWIIDHAPESA